MTRRTKLTVIQDGKHYTPTAAARVQYQNDCHGGGTEIVFAHGWCAPNIVVRDADDVCRPYLLREFQLDRTNVEVCYTYLRHIQSVPRVRIDRKVVTDRTPTRHASQTEVCDFIDANTVQCFCRECSLRLLAKYDAGHTRFNGINLTAYSLTWQVACANGRAETLTGLPSAGGFQQVQGNYVENLNAVQRFLNGEAP